MLPFFRSEVLVDRFWEVLELKTWRLEMKLSMEVKSLRRCCLMSSRVEASSKEAIYSSTGGSGCEGDASSV